MCIEGWVVLFPEGRDVLNVLWLLTSSSTGVDIDARELASPFDSEWHVSKDLLGSIVGWSVTISLIRCESFWFTDGVDEEVCLLAIVPSDTMSGLLSISDFALKVTVLSFECFVAWVGTSLDFLQTTDDHVKTETVPNLVILLLWDRCDNHSRNTKSILWQYNITHMN